jgi:hypothetical protein
MRDLVTLALWYPVLPAGTRLAPRCVAVNRNLPRTAAGRAQRVGRM